LPRCQVECCAQRIVSQAEGHIGCRTFLHHSCGHRILDRWLMRRIPSTHRQGMVSGPSSQRQEAQRKPAPLSPRCPNPTWPYKAFPCFTSVRSVASLAIVREMESVSDNTSVAGWLSSLLHHDCGAGATWAFLWAVRLFAGLLPGWDCFTTPRCPNRD
jgi:hypothetical protein